MILLINWPILYVVVVASGVVGLGVWAVYRVMEHRKRRSLKGCSQVYGGAIYLGTHRQNYRR